MALIANLARTTYVSLAELDVTGMPVGAFVTDVLLGNQFVLTVSDDAVDHVDVESVAGDSSLRWIKYTGGGGAGITALTGDVTASGTGSVAATVANIPTGATLAAKLTATAVAAPATPAAGNGAIYVDSTSKNLCVKDDAGVVKHGVQSQTTAGLIASTISDAGVVGTLTVAQVRALVFPTYYVTASGQYLTLSGLDGDTDGDYAIEGQFECAHGGTTFSFEPNSQNSNLKAFSGNFTTGSSSTTIWPCQANNVGAAGVALGDIYTFSGILTVKTGRRRQIEVAGFMDVAGSATDNKFYTSGVWTETAANMTSFRIAGGHSDSFAAGSWLRLTALGRS